MSITDDAYRYAIRNAHTHRGKADVSAIIGKIMALHPKSNIAENMTIIRKITEKVNTLSPEEIAREYANFESGYELKIPLKKIGLKEFEWMKNEPVITRFAPNPSSYMHFGHIRPAYLSYAYAKKNNGKFILRFDDTDPKVKAPIRDAEKAYLEDLAWLGIIPDEIAYASKHFKLYPTYMEKLINENHAYVCTCDTDDFRKKIQQGKACDCRDIKTEEMRTRFKKMNEHVYCEGEAILRIKTELDHPDPSIRDWWAAKIVDKPNHPNATGINLFPSYNFASAIDDHLLEVTMIIRGSDHSQNVTKQKYIYQYFGWKYPHSYQHGKLSIDGMVLSKTEIEKMVKKEGIEYDDPRIGTIKALRKRNISTEKIKEIIIDLGLKPANTRLPKTILEEKA